MRLFTINMEKEKMRGIKENAITTPNIFAFRVKKEAPFL